MKIVELVQTIVEGVRTIAEIAENKLGVSPQKALEVIRGIANSIRGGANGTLSADEIRAEITRLRANLASNDAAADSELDKKFPK